MDPALLRQRQEFQARSRAVQIPAAASAAGAPGNNNASTQSRAAPSTSARHGSNLSASTLAHAASLASGATRTNQTFARQVHGGSFRPSASSANFRTHIQPSRTSLGHSSSSASISGGAAPPSDVINRTKQLANSIDVLRQHYQKQNHNALSVDEILEELHQVMDECAMAWLFQELQRNHAVEMDEGYKFRYKAPLPGVRTQQELLTLLHVRHAQGESGAAFTDIENCFGPDVARQWCENLYKSGSVFLFPAPEKKTNSKTGEKETMYKKCVVYAVPVEMREFQYPDWMRELWNAASVAGLDEKAMQEKLQQSGLSTISTERKINTNNVGNKRGSKRKVKSLAEVAKDNVHVLTELQDFSHVTNR